MVTNDLHLEGGKGKVLPILKYFYYLIKYLK